MGAVKGVWVFFKKLRNYIKIFKGYPYADQGKKFEN